MRTKCHELSALDVQIYQTAPNQFTVRYGKSTSIHLNYGQAAVEYGRCVMHALARAGKLY